MSTLVAFPLERVPTLTKPQVQPSLKSRVYIYLYIYVHVYRRMHTCVYMYMCICIYVYMYIRIYVDSCLDLCVWTDMIQVQSKPVNKATGHVELPCRNLRSLGSAREPPDVWIASAPKASTSRSRVFQTASNCMSKPAIAGLTFLVGLTTGFQLQLRSQVLKGSRYLILQDIIRLKDNIYYELWD